MSALPITEQDARAIVDRLASIEPGPQWIVTCYLKLEPRDRTRGKYLTKMKNRVKELEASWARGPRTHQERESISADLHRVIEYLEEPGRLPHARGIALFSSRDLGLFEVLPVPHGQGWRLAVDHESLVRELLALEEEFGTILAVIYDRTAARFFDVTAYDCVELTALAGIETTRSGRFHGAHQTPGSAGERNYHMRIRTEKQRLYAQIADRIFHRNRTQSLTGIVLGGVGVDAGAVIPHLHSYVHDLVLGVVKLNPKKTTPAEVRDATLALRDARERAWERAHADAVREVAPEGGAVNGVDPTLKAPTRGHVRTVLAVGRADGTPIDEVVEEGLPHRAQADAMQ